MRKKQVVVIGASDDTESSSTAYNVGRHIALQGHVLITGGRTGVMEQASKGASDAGGLVVGIIPGTDFADANRYCSIVIPSGTGYARNLTNILSGDLIVAVGGKAGTLNEITYAWQFGKPVILCTHCSGWSSKLKNQTIDDRVTGASFYEADSDDKVMELIDSLL